MQDFTSGVLRAEVLKMQVQSLRHIVSSINQNSISFQRELRVPKPVCLGSGGAGPGQL